MIELAEFWKMLQSLLSNVGFIGSGESGQQVFCRVVCWVWLDFALLAQVDAFPSQLQIVNAKMGDQVPAADKIAQTGESVTKVHSQFMVLLSC